MTSESAALSQVICDIYDAAIDPERWRKALQSACVFIGGFECFMFWRDAVVPEANVLHVYNHDRHFAELYREKYAPLDSGFPAAVFLEVGRVHAVTDLIPKQELVQAVSSARA